MVEEPTGGRLWTREDEERRAAAGNLLAEAEMREAALIAKHAELGRRVCRILALTVLPADFPSEKIDAIRNAAVELGLVRP